MNYTNKPVIIKKEQAAMSVYTPGNVYFDYPGSDKPLVATGDNFINHPEIIQKITDLFTKDLYIESAGKVKKININELI
jgi:hypothetical protein